jgi:hypothetical protein
MENNGELYYIRKKNRYLGNAVYWWRPDGRGYTVDIKDAGKYTKEKAESIVNTTSSDNEAYLCSRIDQNYEALKLVVDAQYIDKPDIEYKRENL